MAQMEVNDGLENLIRDLEAAAEDLPDLRRTILNAQADLVEPALRSAVGSSGLVRSGKLRDSIRRSSRKQGTEIHVGPTGVHHRYLRISGSGKAMSGHVGYIHEYGAPSRGIRPKKWMAGAVAGVSEKAYKAAETAHDEYMKNHNL